MQNVPRNWQDESRRFYGSARSAIVPPTFPLFELLLPDPRDFLAVQIAARSSVYPVAFLFERRRTKEPRGRSLNRDGRGSRRALANYDHAARVHRFLFFSSFLFEVLFVELVRNFVRKAVLSGILEFINRKSNLLAVE